MSPLFKKTPKTADTARGPEKAESRFKNIFAGKEKMPAIGHGTETLLGDIGRRLRVLEDRYNSLRKQFQFTDQIMLKNKKEINTEIKAMDLTLSEINKEIIELKDKAARMSSELKGCARLSELKIIEKYIDLWKPVNFLTRDQAIKMIKEYAKKNK
ncbi:MAG: hypothetical protein KAT43_00185 [Nanoarchaeota archaeon]|nr:hypothetical protein [Nanoarchaeota archaeon]